LRRLCHFIWFVTYLSFTPSTSIVFWFYYMLICVCSLLIFAFTYSIYIRIAPIPYGLVWCKLLHCYERIFSKPFFFVIFPNIWEHTQERNRMNAHCMVNRFVCLVAIKAMWEHIHVRSHMKVQCGKPFCLYGSLPTHIENIYGEKLYILAYMVIYLKMAAILDLGHF